jgi:hypothetical protein
MKRRVLSETTPFHPLFKKKRRSPNGVVLNGTVGLLFPLDARGRGRRIFSLAFLLSFFLRKLQKDVDTTPHLLNF